MFLSRYVRAGFVLASVMQSGSAAGAGATVESGSTGEVLPVAEQTRESGKYRSSVSAGVFLDFASPIPSRAHQVAFADYQFSLSLASAAEAKPGDAASLELGGEILAGGQWNPDADYFTALMPSLRWNLLTKTALIPYLQGGGGVAFTDIGRPDLGSVFEFVEYAGMGLRWRCQQHLDIFAESRVMHVSNAGIKKPNRGITGATLQVGAGWSF